MDIFSEIKILTGAILYPDDESGLLDKQLEILKLFLRSSQEFSQLTTNEIRHAFYLNNQGAYDQVYRHYNKEMNAEFLGDVLLAYVKHKKRLYGRAGADIRALLNPPPPPPKVMITAEQWMEMIQRDYDYFRAGDLRWIFNAGSKYLFLRKIDLIPLRDKVQWHVWYRSQMDRRRAFSRRLPADQREKDAIREARVIYEGIDRTGTIPIHEHRLLVGNLRHHVYLRFFEVIADCAINNIFQDIKIERPLP